MSERRTELRRRTLLTGRGLLESPRWNGDRLYFSDWSAGEVVAVDLERAVALTLSNPPGETTHWTAGLAAQQLGISVSSVQRIWRAHGLQPHRVRQFKLSRDRQFVD